MPYYESSKSMLTAACYENSNNDDKSNNNKDKVCLLIKRWGLVDHILDHMLNHMLDQMLNHIIIDLITLALQGYCFSQIFWIWQYFSKGISQSAARVDWY